MHVIVPILAVVYWLGVVIVLDKKADIVEFLAGLAMGLMWPLMALGAIAKYAYKAYKNSRTGKHHQNQEP